MSLKNDYNNMKKNRPANNVLFAKVLCTLIICMAYVWAIFLGWNSIIAKIFNLPNITYWQTMGILIWVYFLKALYVGVPKK